jgi:superfamily II DNA or RNA helicase
LVQHILRVATAYFSIKGYNLGRKHLAQSVQLHILVGRQEGEHVYKAVLEEIRRELRQSDMDLYDAVVDLVERMRAGRFRIRDAREMERPFHCKFYICDDVALWHGSANFSTNGLQEQAEQVEASHDAEHIQRWANWYDEVARDARDLLAEIRDELEKWLAMADPFDVYLKTLLLLFGLPDGSYQQTTHLPVYYQQAIVAWALRQLDGCGGALVVVATGLGKTVIGTEIAARLYATREVERVVLIAPNTVHTAWKVQLEGRRVLAKVFGSRTLFRDRSGIPHHQTYGLDEQLDQAGADTLILIDEAHAYRNQLLARSAKGQSRVLARLGSATLQGARIVLLTASAYGTNIQNLNSLLYLLPHRCPNALGEPGAWQVSTHHEFIGLPHVCVLGVPHVMEMVRQRGDVDGYGRPFIPFANGRHYLPRLLRSERVLYTLPLWSELRDAFDGRCFDQARKVPTLRYDDELGECKSVTDTVYNVALDSWLSSPPALRHSIEQNLATRGGTSQISLDFDQAPVVWVEAEGAIQQELWTEPNQSVPPLRRSSPPKRSARSKGYRTLMCQDAKTRRERLDVLQQRLRRRTGVKDDKLQKLVYLVHARRLDKGAKVIIFVEMYPTALYLETELRRMFGERLRVACTVRKGKDSPGLKRAQERAQLLRQFSPCSHGYLPQHEYDILICTDADGVGVNLQDADTVVNYDMLRGADVLVQRLGRIIRPTADPDRLLRVYTFVPSCVDEVDASAEVQGRIRERYGRLVRRHEKSSEILGASVLVHDESEDISLDGDVKIEELLRHFDVLGDMEGEVSLATHLAVLEQYRTRAESLRYTVHSARYSPIQRIFQSHNLIISYNLKRYVISCPAVWSLYI